MTNGEKIAKRRRKYRVEFKLRAVDYCLANGRNIYKTSRRFQVTDKMIRNWIRVKDRLERVQCKTNRMRVSCRDHQTQLPELDELVQSLSLESIEPVVVKKRSDSSDQPFIVCFKCPVEYSDISKRSWFSCETCSNWSCSVCSPSQKRGAEFICDQCKSEASKRRRE